MAVTYDEVQQMIEEENERADNKLIDNLIELKIEEEKIKKHLKGKK